METGFELVLTEVYATWYESNVHNILAAAHARTKERKKNQT
jgi:hypothetical protein